MIRNWRGELLFGQEKLFVSAKHLVNDNTITRDHTSDEVTYYHFMFDSHQTVWSNGLETESFHPGESALSGIEDAARDELFNLFPELKSNPETFGPTCLPTLKGYEADAMFNKELSWT